MVSRVNELRIRKWRNDHYYFEDGNPISEPINVKSIVKDIEYEKKRIVELQKVIEKKNEEIKNEPEE